MQMELYEHQKQALEATANKNRVAYYMDMGLGKTHTSSEKMIQLGAKFNLVVCQKSKVDDWYNHFKDNYDVNPCDLTKVKAKDLEHFIEQSKSVPVPTVYVINYDLVWRRKQLLQLKDFTLILDESSLIQNEQAKRSKFILKLQPKNVILLSGTPTSGKYETLWSQMHLLGWKISKELYLNTYVDYHWDESNGFPVRIIDGYKNVDRLKRKMRQYGCYFLKTEDCINLPEQIDQTIRVPVTTEYQIFKKDRICTVEDNELVGDTVLTKLLYQRQLCGQYNSDKLEAFRDLVESTNERLIVFYNFNAELYKLWDIAEELSRPISAVNGNERSLREYETQDNSITFIQYQAGSKGLNLQKANRIIFFTPPLSSEIYEQSRKRIHRIGQSKTCFYYQLTCKGSVEERIYKTLAMRKDYTDELFREEEDG
jgi:SNF2 family DNA or RNA helicase